MRIVKVTYHDVLSSGTMCYNSRTPWASCVLCWLIGTGWGWGMGAGWVMVEMLTGVKGIVCDIGIWCATGIWCVNGCVRGCSRVVCWPIGVCAMVSCCDMVTWCGVNVACCDTSWFSCGTGVRVVSCVTGTACWMGAVCCVVWGWEWCATTVCCSATCWVNAVGRIVPEVSVEDACDRLSNTKKYNILIWKTCY